MADVGGHPNAPTVLLLHGGGQTLHAWGGTAAALARAGWRAVALDLPGHGESALGKNLRRNAAGRWVWHWDPRLMSDENHSHRNDPAYFERALADYRGELLLIRGARSDVLSAAGAERFRSTFSHARGIDLADAGHMVAGDVNDVFTDTVIDLLSDMMPPPGGVRPGVKQP